MHQFRRGLKCHRDQSRYFVCNKMWNNWDRLFCVNWFHSADPSDPDDLVPDRDMPKNTTTHYWTSKFSCIFKLANVDCIKIKLKTRFHSPLLLFNAAQSQTLSRCWLCILFIEHIYRLNNTQEKLKPNQFGFKKYLRIAYDFRSCINMHFIAAVAVLRHDS